MAAGGSADDAVAEGPGQTGARADARTEPGFRAADIQTFDLMRPESESEGEGGRGAERLRRVLYSRAPRPRNCNFRPLRGPERG